MFRHTMLFLGYELGNVRRNPVWPLFGLMQPILYLLLFAPLLTGLPIGGKPSGGTLANALGTPAGVDIAMLAALGQMASIWSGGGTLVPWGVLDIAGVTGIDPELLTRRNFLPVMAGLLAATVVAIFLM